MKFVTRIEQEARKASEVISQDEDLKKAFIKGAYFSIGYLNDRLAVSPMEGKVETYLDTLRLKDVREVLSFLLSGVKQDEP